MKPRFDENTAALGLGAVVGLALLYCYIYNTGANANWPEAEVFDNKTICLSIFFFCMPVVAAMYRLGKDFEAEPEIYEKMSPMRRWLNSPKTTEFIFLVVLYIFQGIMIVALTKEVAKHVF